MGPSPQMGSEISRYRLLEKLGEGGMGVVWLAEDTRLERKIALKFLTAEAALDDGRRQRFEQEARAAAALSHPGIATVHELGEDKGQIFIVFEHVSGSTLRRSVVAGGLPSGEVVSIASDIAKALAAAHGSGVVHRDLKPENVMRTPSGACKILDFGLARLVSAGPPGSDANTLSRLTTAGMVVGTVGYMSPEQLEGKEVDFRCDIFAFGTLVYELATGFHPFQGSSPASTMAAILTREPEPLSQRNAMHPPELERIVRKCLRKRPEDRYQSTSDLVVDLRELKHDSSERPERRSTPVPLSAGETSLFHRWFSKVGASPRQWWELHQLFSIFVMAPVILALLWQARQAADRQIPTADPRRWYLEGIGSGFLVACLLLITSAVMVRLYLVCVAGFIPDRLEAEIRRLHRTSQSLSVLISMMLAVTAYSLWRFLPFQEPLLEMAFAGLSFASAITALMVEPGMRRTAFPQAFTPAPQAATSPTRSWWWMHQLWTMFGTTPFIIYLLWTAHEGLTSDWRMPLFISSAIVLGLHWSVRFALISMVIGNREIPATEVRRMGPWIQWTGRPVVVVLILHALAMAGKTDALSAIFGALAMGGVVCLAFLDPSVERAAFPNR